MRAVFTFWQLLEEEEDFLDYLDTTGRPLGYHNHWVRNSEEIEGRDLRQFLIDHDPQRCNIGLDCEAMEVTIEEHAKEDTSFFSVGLFDSCLVGYQRPRFRSGKKLGQSNIAAYRKTARLERKPDEFLLWIRRVFGWVRKRASTTYKFQRYNYPATPRFVEKVNNGEIEAAF